MSPDRNLHQTVSRSECIDMLIFRAPETTILLNITTEIKICFALNNDFSVIFIIPSLLLNDFQSNLRIVDDSIAQLALAAAPIELFYCPIIVFQLQQQSFPLSALDNYVLGQHSGLTSMFHEYIVFFLISFRTV